MDTQQITASLADIMRQHARVALLFSGGIESCLLLRLLEPWRSQVAVYHVRAGAEFDHMVRFVDRKLEGWKHRIIRTDLSASFRDLGIPASVVPIEHVQGIADQVGVDGRAPRIVPWVLCCLANRSIPGYDAMKEDGYEVVIHGQRSGDWPQQAPQKTGWPGLTFVHPLWDLSRVEVQEAVTALRVELPRHYADYSSSLDCSVCPSSLTTPRRAWMSQHYPEHLAVAEKLHADVSQAVIAALDGDNTKNGFAVR